jgi:carboxypeptidase D
VDSLPDIDYDYGEMYSGVMNIKEDDDSRGLFFVFQPKKGEPVKTITIWFNGGPGCSSLEGFLQENGQYVWAWGQYNAIPNPYSWVNLTNMLW